jgi:hypothetical protein
MGLGSSLPSLYHSPDKMKSQPIERQQMSEWTEYARQYAAERGLEIADDWSDERLQDQIDDGTYSVVNAYIDEHTIVTEDNQ